MKSLLEITSLLLQDCGRLCGVNPFRDLVEVTRRFEHEGASFLTITLPTFAAGLEKALQQGHWSPTLAPAFAGRRRGSLPRFLGGFLDQVFEVDGTIKEFSDEQARPFGLFGKFVEQFPSYSSLRRKSASTPPSPNSSLSKMR
jgi:hypothetical protein